MRTAGRALLVATALAALSACSTGTTNSEPTEVAQTANAAEQYCSLSAELDAQEGSPSEEQLAEIEAVAPDEIADHVATLAEAVRSQDFTSPEVGEAESALLAWEEENCVDSLEVEPGPEGAEETEPAP